MVIFDKDGTLIDFDFMWASWVEKLSKDMAMLCRKRKISLVNESLDAKLFPLLGYDSEKRTVVSGGMLCCTPMHKIRGAVKQMLEVEYSIAGDIAEEILKQTYGTPTPDTSNVKTLGDLREAFTELKEKHKLKIGVCTTDDHEPTTDMLKMQGVADLVDVVIGGDDKHAAPKPSPEQIQYLCKQVEVDPKDVIMIGDTNTDMQMGKAAGVFLNIGIMHGASSVKDLEVNADVLVPSFEKMMCLMRKLCSS